MYGIDTIRMATRLFSNTRKQHFILLCILLYFFDYVEDSHMSYIIISAWDM